MKSTSQTAQTRSESFKRMRQNLLGTQLRKALHNREIVPYFQPLVQIRTGKLAGFEVLSRWPHPTRGMVPPDEFIPVAERTGLIGKLTESILLQAFAATANLPQNLQIAVNVSPLQLRDPSLPEQIRRAAEQRGFPLERLTIEITESALVDNLEQAASIARKLKRLGVLLSLDDFGTGYSSLRNLQSLPFDKLKVDRSFVSSMIDNRESRKIVSAVVGLGHSLKLETVAEGVENESQAAMLLWLGCDLGQGWLYGKAVPERSLQSLLRSEMPAAGGVEAAAPASDLCASIEPLPVQRLAQCQAIYDGAPAGICFVDADLRYVNANQRLAEMNGLPISALLGRKVSDILAPDVFASVEPYLLRALSGEAFGGVELRRPAPNGRPGYLTQLLSYQPARDEAGEVVGVSVMVVDITERKNAEDALRESEDHYRHMVQLSPHIPWVMDADGMNTEVSQGWEELTGQPPEEVRNLGWNTVVHPKDLVAITPVIQASLRSGEPIDVEYRVRDRDGRWRWIRSRARARRSEDGRITRWYGVAEDITNPGASRISSRGTGEGSAPRRG